MRVQRADHAVNRAFDQLGVIGFFGVVGPYPLEYLTEQPQLRVGVSADLSFGDRDRKSAGRRGDEQGQTSPCRRSEETAQDILAHWRTFSLFSRCGQCSGFSPQLKAGA